MNVQLIMKTFLSPTQTQAVCTHMEKCPDSGFWRRFVAIWHKTWTSQDASCTVAVKKVNVLVNKIQFLPKF